MTEEKEVCTDEEIEEYIVYAKSYMDTLKRLMSKLEIEIDSPDKDSQWMAIWVIRCVGLAANKAIHDIEGLDPDSITH